MIKKSTPIHTIAFWVILIGGAFCVTMPLIAPMLPIQYLREYGEIGDAIGGISSPLVQILGSAVLFLALKAQIDANGILQLQIEKENKKEQLRHEINQLHELYLFVERNIKNFSYDQKTTVDGKSHKTLLHSRRAIKCFIEDLENLDVDIHNDADVLMYDGVKEIMSILNSVELFFEKIKNSNIEAYHKNFHKTLMQHELLFSIFPYQELDNKAHLKQEPCPECGVYHANYPPLIYDRLQEIKKSFF
ncbi:MAG: hypothetical protein KF681_10995 [Bdellovibrionaceae bacterium]|nr:hypothetical protein [Pseudobdellovibrionaceae bacterium]MBX3040690.1 hypothetical protein [Pseudobdellovibrionaceae bacterium]